MFQDNSNEVELAGGIMIAKAKLANVNKRKSSLCITNLIDSLFTPLEIQTKSWSGRLTDKDPKNLSTEEKVQLRKSRAVESDMRTKAIKGMSKKLQEVNCKLMPDIIHFRIRAEALPRCRR